MLFRSGATSGSTTVVASATASGTITLPAGTGTATVNGVSTNIVSGTSQATTSGTSFTFTGIPSWAKRITVLFNGVSLSGTDNFLIQIGSGSVTTSGYNSATGYGGTSSGVTAPATSTSGFVCQDGSSANVIYGNVLIHLFSNYTYISAYTAGSVQSGSTPYFNVGGGSVTLSGALDRVKILTTGTNTFTAGSINILYE